MTFEDFIRQLPMELTVAQKKAVEQTEGPTLLLAVPGSGKTTVLVSRLGYMVYGRQIPPEQILVLTYTVAATRDMRERTRRLFGEPLAARVEFRTINGLCSKIIGYYASVTGRNAYSLISDDREQGRILGEVYRQVEKDYPTENDLKEIRTWITYAKNSMLSQQEIRKLDLTTKRNISGIYQAYNERLKGMSMMDYDDQMVYAYFMLLNIPGLLDYFQGLYPYICVDEAQDTSRIQHAIIALLAQKTQNLFMVGDEDQSIYGFRAAYPQALLNFEKDHPAGQVLLMEDNFRSDGYIVETADRFIQANTLRHKKHMRAVEEKKCPVEKIPVLSRRKQYDTLLQAADTGCRMTILYRDNECALPLIDLFERNHVEYRIKNQDMVFFTHPIVNDIRDIQTLAQNPGDVDAFLRIYYKIGTYLKKEDAYRAAERSLQDKIPVLEAAIRMNGTGSRQVSNLRMLQKQLELVSREPAEQAINRIVQYMGYGVYLERMKFNDGKLEILKILGSREVSLEKLMNRLDILRDTIQDKTDVQESRIILSTIHGSKGLEYDTVYLLDVADGIFPETPHKKGVKYTDKEIAEYEEERRLFYVGITRARKHLYLFEQKGRSSFVEELVQSRPKQKPAILPQFRVGNMLRHKVFGEGEILETDGVSVVVRFKTGVRTMRIEILLNRQLIEL